MVAGDMAPGSNPVPFPSYEREIDSSCNYWWWGGGGGYGTIVWRRGLTYNNSVWRRGLPRYLSGPTNVSSIPAAIVFFLLSSCSLGSGWLVGIRRQ